MFDSLAAAVTTVKPPRRFSRLLDSTVAFDFHLQLLYKAIRPKKRLTVWRAKRMPSIAATVTASMTSTFHNQEPDNRKEGKRTAWNNL